MTSSFFPPLVEQSPSHLAETLSLHMVGTGDVASLLTGVAPIEEASAGALTFLDNVKYAHHLGSTKASCVILAEKFQDTLPDGIVGLISREPYRDFARAAALLVPAAVSLRPLALTDGVSPAAHVDPSAKLEEGAVVEPGAVVGPHAAVGRGTVIGAGAVVAHHVQVGRSCYVGANATVQHTFMGDRVIVHSGVCIGQDGFGFAMGPQGHLKVPQMGRVIVQDDVEIGAGTTIDRGTTRDTVIGEGTKIDNLVQIGHNVEIGRHCVIVGQVGISGSTILEDFVVLGGQVGIVGHVRIGMGAQIAGSSNVKDDVPAGARWAGTPAKPARAFFRELTAVKRLGEQGSKAFSRDS